jgi:molybdopterin molybdotransferase
VWCGRCLTRTTESHDALSLAAVSPQYFGSDNTGALRSPAGTRHGERGDDGHDNIDDNTWRGGQCRRAAGGRLPVDDALERVLAAVSPLTDLERIPARQALGRVLAEEVAADLDVPPFDNCAMDGYAVRVDDVAGAAPDRPVTLRVLGEIAAGMAATQPITPGQAYRVLTGAPLPPGADTVVPYEDTDGKGFGGWSGEAGSQFAAEEREVRVFRAWARGDNVRYRGEDQRAGEAILRAGTVLRPAEAGVLATLGRTDALVRRRPRAAVLSTGDEVVDPAQPLRPGQIRDANSHSVAALVQHYGAEPLPLGIVADDPAAVRRKLDEALALSADLVLTSGGVSYGDRDVVKLVLREHGSVDFWAVDMRPGGPLTFGRYGGVPVVGLPGNPVASMVAFELFGRPLLLKLAGHARLQKVDLFATTLQPITNRSGKEAFMRGIVERRPGASGGEPEWTVRLTGEQGSGILTSMMKANALVRLARGARRIEAGARVRVLMLDWPSLW